MATPRLRVTTGLAVWLLVACGGYPSEDIVPPNPFDIGNAERLQALDALGAKAYHPERRRFAMDSDCTLRITRSGGPQRPERFAHVLAPGMHVGISSNKALGVFEVHLLTDSGRDPQRLGLLLRSSTWTHAAKAELLLQLLIRDCRLPAPPEAGAA
ncbi:MAG TPA: hypothetical protein VGE36_21805 [Roseateles sp.]